MVRWTLIVVLISFVPTLLILLLTDHTLIGYITAGVGGIRSVVRRYDREAHRSSAIERQRMGVVVLSGLQPELRVGQPVWLLQ